MQSEICSLRRHTRYGSLLSCQRHFLINPRLRNKYLFTAISLLVIASFHMYIANIGCHVTNGLERWSELELHYLNDNEKNYQAHVPVSIISSMYFINQFSKHPEAYYERWVSNFLSINNTGIVVFTDLLSFHKLREIMSGRSRAAFIWLDICAAPNIKRFEKEYMFEQQNLDRESNIHSPLLYCIWNAKPWMLQTVAEQNPFRSDFFLWVDAGSFRQGSFQNWPSIDRLSHIFDKIVPDQYKQMILGLVSCPDANDQDLTFSLVDHDMIQGGFFAGKKEAISNFAGHFYAIHDRLIKKGLFVGKEQTLLNRLVLEKPDLYIAIDTRQSCGDPWFFFQQVLAMEEDDQCNSVLIDVIKPFRSICKVSGRYKYLE